MYCRGRVDLLAKRHMLLRNVKDFTQACSLPGRARLINPCAYASSMTVKLSCFFNTVCLYILGWLASCQIWFFPHSLGVCRQQGWLESRAHPIGDLSRRALKSIPPSGVSASQARLAEVIFRQSHAKSLMFDDDCGLLHISRCIPRI